MEIGFDVDASDEIWCNLGKLIWQEGSVYQSLWPFWSPSKIPSKSSNHQNNENFVF